MAVPANSAAYLRNTTNGAFVKQNQGGTVLGNTTTGDAITKALALKDNATDPVPTLPKVKNNGLSANQKAQSGGTFAYEVAGKYVIMTISDTLSGVSNTIILIPSRTKSFSSNDAIMRSRGSYVAKTVTAFRNGRFSWTSTKRDGTAIGARVNWLNVASGGMDTATAPDALNEDFWDPAAGSTSANSDSAANPTRAVPGELILLNDFVDADISTSGNFFDYKSITGM